MILNFENFINEAKRFSGSLVMKDREKMKSILRENIVTFKFQKRDGTIRKAIGTLYSPILPPVIYKHYPRPAYQMVYYDLEKFAWRSFRSFKFIKILKMVPITEEIIEKYIEKREKFKLEKEAEKHHRKLKKEETEDEEVLTKEDTHSEDERKKTYKSGEKIPEKELLRRSVDLRSGTKKSKTTKEANDKFKKGELED